QSAFRSGVFDHAEAAGLGTLAQAQVVAETPFLHLPSFLLPLAHDRGALAGPAAAVARDVHKCRVHHCGRSDAAPVTRPTANKGVEIDARQRRCSVGLVLVCHGFSVLSEWRWRVSLLA